MVEVLESRSPQAPLDVVATVAMTPPDAVASVVIRARKAGQDWAASPALARCAALHGFADSLMSASDELANLVMREVGKPITEAQAEIARSIAILRYFAQQALEPDGETYPSTDGRSWLMARRRPHGVVGLITPWNFPAAIPLWKAAPALAFGNAVVLKPASFASGVAVRLGKLAADHLPPDVFSVVTGSGETGAALIDLTDCISFTGSTTVGEHVRVRAAQRGIPAQCEMGGQNASIVLADADHQRSAAMIAAAAMGYAGQKCTATSRVIVEGSVEAFTESLAAAVLALRIGDPASADVSVGPVISQSARDEVIDAADKARNRGATVVTGGRAVDGDGYFVEPTLITGVSPDDELAQEEIFGPLCVVLPATDADDAIRIANGVRFGLVGSVFTESLDRAMSVVDRLDVGMVRVNAPTSGVDFHAPFGGVKQSSYGPREQGKAAQDFYTSLHTITVASSR